MQSKIKLSLEVSRKVLERFSRKFDEGTSFGNDVKPWDNPWLVIFANLFRQSKYYKESKNREKSWRKKIR